MSFKKTRRGGSWGYGGLAAARYDSYQADQYYGCGFRLAARAEPQTMLMRGGSWSRDSWFCRSAYRRANRPDIRDSSYGLRLAGRVSK